MLKWVVTRGPQTMCNDWEAHKDHQWIWNKENKPIHQQLNVENNNNIPSERTKPLRSIAFSPNNYIGIHRTVAVTKTLKSTTSSQILKETSPNNTASSFGYFLVDNHSSPLKFPKHFIDDCASCCASPMHTSSYRKAIRRRQRRRLSSLDIREPSELASPSYRQADDPANDLSVDLLLTPSSDRLTTVNVPSSPWKEVSDMYVTYTENYNEREIKTPEAESTTMLNQESRQLVRRRAVRRKKPTRSAVRDVQRS